MAEEVEVFELNVRRPELRRQRIGTDLLGAGTRCIPPDNDVILWVIENNNPAIALYESLGFERDWMIEPESSEIFDCSKILYRTQAARLHATFRVEYDPATGFAPA